MFRVKQSSRINKGKKHTVFFAFMLFVKIILLNATLLLGINTLQAKEPVSVGVVNVTFLMENAPQAAVASAELKNKFLPQEKKLAEDLDEINKLSKELEKLSNTSTATKEKRQKERELRTRKRARSRLLQDFREELRFARNAALDDVQKDVFSAIDSVRKREHIDIILQDYVSADKRVDITPLVLGFLQSKLKGIQTPKNNLGVNK